MCQFMTSDSNLYVLGLDLVVNTEFLFWNLVLASTFFEFI